MAKKNIQVEAILDGLKLEIMNEFGIEQLDGNSTSRECGQIGGMMTKRLIAIAEELLQEQNKQ